MGLTVPEKEGEYFEVIQKKLVELSFGQPTHKDGQTGHLPSKPAEGMSKRQWNDA